MPPLTPSASVGRWSTSMTLPSDIEAASAIELSAAQPIIRVLGLNSFITAPMPLINPPPPIEAKTFRRAGTHQKFQPWPAITSGSL